MKKCIMSLYFMVVMGGCLVAQNIPKTAYVVNTLGQNLSVINLENGNVTPDALPLGLFTNFIKIRGEKAFVVNSGINEIQVINLNPLATINHIDVGNNTNPWSLDFVNDSIAVVSLLLTDQVAIVNVNSGQVLQYVDVGIGPEGIKFYNGKIYVANTGFIDIGNFAPGTVSVIDAATFAVTDTFDVGINPQDLDVDSQGRLIVVCTGDYSGVNGQMDIIDLNSGNIVSTIPFTSAITSVGINEQDKCYIGTTGSGVMVYDLLTQSFERSESNPLSGGPGIDFDQQNNAYITDFSQDSVRVFSPSHQTISAYLVGDGPNSIAIFDSALTTVNPLVDINLDDFRLYQNYPNPFNPSTTISYKLNKGGTVRLEIFNLVGEKIRTLVDANKAAGSYQVTWDGKSENGTLMPSGIFFYRLRINDFSESHKMHLIR